MAPALFCGVGGGGFVYAGRMVCRSQQACMESTGVDLRSGLDGVVCDDGGGGLAGVATRRFCRATPPTWDVPRAVGAQRTMDAAILRPASSGLGVCGNHPPVAGHSGYASGLSARESHRSLASRAISGLGEFRGGAKRHNMEVELVTGAESRAEHLDPALRLSIGRSRRAPRRNSKSLHQLPEAPLRFNHSRIES